MLTNSESDSMRTGSRPDSSIGEIKGSDMQLTCKKHGDTPVQASVVGKSALAQWPHSPSLTLTMAGQRCNASRDDGL
jgi:hypothetical protein